MKSKNMMKSVFIPTAVALSFFSTPSIAVDTFSPSVKNLMADVIQQGTVMVIVNLRSPLLPDSVESLSSKEKDKYLTEEIARIQEAVLERLADRGENIKNPTKYKFSSQMALTVTEIGLEALMFDPDVEKILENKASDGSLGSSVPIVFPSYQTSPYSGEGWTVVSIDSGVDKFHPAFGDRVVAEACFSIDEEIRHFSLCPNSEAEQIGEGAGIDCTAKLNSLLDTLPSNINNGGGCDHGTGTAGVAVGNFGDIQGVARDANLIAIQTTTAVIDVDKDDGQPILVSRFFPSNVVSALEHVYNIKDDYKIASVNISIGGEKIETKEQCSEASTAEAIRPMVEMLKEEGIAVVTAAGNNNYANAVVDYACLDSVISVGAVNDNDGLYALTNRGMLLDLFAPGVQIETATAGGEIAAPTQGTSFAAPHVAGAWAVMKQSKPDASVEEIKNAFKTTGKTITTEGDVMTQRINIDEALDVLSDSEPAPEMSILEQIIALKAASWTQVSDRPVRITANARLAQAIQYNNIAAANYRQGKISIGNKYLKLAKASIIKFESTLERGISKNKFPEEEVLPLLEAADLIIANINNLMDSSS